MGKVGVGVVALILGIVLGVVGGGLVGAGAGAAGGIEAGICASLTASKEAGLLNEQQADQALQRTLDKYGRGSPNAVLNSFEDCTKILSKGAK